MKRFILLMGIFVCAQAAISQTAYTWNGSVSTAWNTPANWSPNGIPSNTDNVTIVNGSNVCLLTASSGINNLIVTSGTLDLGGFSLSTSGPVATFTKGTVQNGIINVSAATSTIFGNGPMTMNCIVNVVSASVTFRNTIFQNTTTITKSGAGNDASSGNNVFNGTTNITGAGTGYLMLGNGSPDTFNGPVTFNNTGSSNLYVAYNSANNVFDGVTTFNNAPAANTLIYVSWLSAGTSFNNDVVVSSAGGQGVQFCGGNGTASATLAAGKSIQIGAGGFSAGTLLLRQFAQTGATAQHINLTGTANLTYGPASSFGGDVTSSSPTLFLNGATFNGVSDLTKTGSTGDYSAGGDVFNGACSISNSGSSYLLLGNSNPDTWNGDVTFTDNGSERLLPCWATAGNQFNGNITVNTSGSATGIQFCGGNATATAILAAGKTILTGSTGLTAGYLYLKQFTQSGNAPINLNATGSSVLYLGPSSNFGGAVTVAAPDIWAQGATYNSTAAFTKTAGSNNHNNQYQNIFKSTCTINQQSNTGYFMLGYNSNDLFNDDIILNSTGSGGIYLGWTSGTGTPTLSAGKTILVGGGGFSSGFLYLNSFTQLGSAGINLSFTGTNSFLNIARGSVIGGNISSSSADIFLTNSTFNGTVNVTKTGTANDASGGGNIFQEDMVINNAGTGSIIFGNGAPDTWNSDVSFNSSGSSYIALGWNSTGNMFNGNITVSSTGSSTGIQFDQTAISTAILAAAKTLQVGPAGFSSGTLMLKQFTQLGSAAVNLNFTGATTLIQVGPSSVLGGDFTVTSPRILLNGAVYNGQVTLTKSGAMGEWSSGGNIFNSTLTVNQNGAGYFGFANGSPDVYNGDVYANNNSTERIIFGNNPVGNQFNGNIILTQTGSSVGIAFGWSASTSETLAAGKTISIGAAGFNTGYLQIERFTQLGNAPINLPLTGTSSLTFGPTSSLGGNLTSTSGSLFFNGCNFAGTVTSMKNGGTNDGSIGNNTFNGAFSITNTGAGYFLMGNGNPDLWQSTAVFNNQSTAQQMYVAYSSTGNIFNGDVVFNNQPASAALWIYANNNGVNTQFNGNISVVNVNGAGVYFGSASGTAFLAAGKTIGIGAGGFNSGGLILRGFTQTGPGTSQSLLTIGTSYVQYGPGASFDGDVTSTSPGLFFSGSTFNGMANCLKTGTSNDQSQGNNIFNRAATFTNNGTGYLLMAATNPDAYNGNVVFIQNNTGLVYPNYNANCSYAGNVTVTSPAASAITFGSNAGTATFSGTGAQSISATGGTPVPVFTRLIIANTGSGVTLNNSSINVSKNLILASGLLNTSTSFLLTMLNGSTTATGTSLSTSYVNGPMRYQKSTAGASTLNFPIGSGGDCRPVALTVSHTSGNLYTYQAQLFNASAAALGYTFPVTVDAVSAVHYYTISRVNAASVSQPSLELSGNQTIQLFFGSNDVVRNGGTLTIVKNTFSNLTKWIDIGGTGGPVFTGNPNLSGSITSTSLPTAFNSFSTFALADGLGGGNILPIDLLYFKAKPVNGQVDLTWATATESHNSHFTIEKSKDASNFDFVGDVSTEAVGGNSSVELDYSSPDTDPYSGISYYRLKQTDQDGNYSYSKIVSVNLAKTQVLSIYPNPSSGVLFISGLGTTGNNLKVAWYDASGRSLLQQVVPVQNGIARLNPPFSSGIYVLRFMTADGAMTVQQIIINK